ncbi:MAG: DUF4258 domain-containing protein [Actinomycetota bacterium]
MATFSDHANMRMAQRGITAEEVEEVLADPQSFGPAQSGCTELVGATAAGRRLRVTRFEDRDVIVSVVAE